MAAIDPPAASAGDLSVSSTGTGPRIVWVDPALGSSAMRPLEDALRALSEHVEVVVYDRRGRGESPGLPVPTAASEVDDLVAVVTASAPVSAVVGFSSGAALVLHAATRLPVDRLVLIEPAVDETPDVSGLRSTVADRLADGDPDAAVRAFYAATGMPEEIVADVVASAAWPALVRSAPTLLADIDLTLVPDSLVARIDTPVDVIVSTGSPAEITDMSTRIAARLSARVWREPGGWHGVDADALTSRVVALLTPESAAADDPTVRSGDDA